MKKLPIGTSTLKIIRDDDCVYIDKTHHVERITNSGGRYFFLSRPRRFGKSLLVDTLKQAFLGNKDVFKGLYLEKDWDWDVQYPVIHLDFGIGQFKSIEQFNYKINYLLDEHYQKYQLDNRETDVSIKFDSLIKQLAKKFSSTVVILVDEYDKPIIDNITEPQLSGMMRDELKSIYGVLKAQDKNIRFAFLTGVSKFSKVSLFSDINNFDDISLDPNYADICGYTQLEMDAAFSEYFKDGNVDKVKLKAWYNGYNFTGLESQKVYNPFDILLFCSKNYRYKNYWFETATPTFLIKLLQSKQYFIPNLESILVSESELSSFDVDKIPISTLLFQTGYLTVKEISQIGTQYAYILTYPNLEVKTSLNDCLLTMGSSIEAKGHCLAGVDKALRTSQFDELKSIFNSHFSSIPHDWYRKNPMGQFEGFYASIIYSCFCALGYDVTAEDVTSFGNIDLTVVMPDKILIIEFKLSKYGSAIDAIKQIKDKKYAYKFKGDKRPTYLIGMSFDDKTKTMEGLLWENG